MQQKEILSDSIVEEPPKKETLVNEESDDIYLFNQSILNNNSKLPPMISQELLDRLKTISIKNSASNSFNENTVGEVLNNGMASSNSNVSSSSAINSNYTNSDIYNENEDFNLAKHLQEEENVYT